MGEEEGSWDNTLDEWLISEGHCYAAAMSGEDGVLYAAAPAAEEKGWSFVFKDDHEEDVLQEDGSTYKKVTVSEAKSLHCLMKNEAYEGGQGLWLCGEKYKMCQRGTEELGEHSFPFVFANLPKKGVHIVATPKTNQYILGLYNEELGQNTGNCKKAVLAFAEHLAGMEY